MIIDTHIHESEYSFDSKMSLEEIIKTAKKRNLDGICITNHDNNKLKEKIGEFSIKNGIIIIVGAEILTKQGDILTFGLNEIPTKMIESGELSKRVKLAGGVTVSAHPFRNNNRGLGNHIQKIEKNLTAVETYNGSTDIKNNLRAESVAQNYNLGEIGASDAHVVEQIGCYATKFLGQIRDHADFIEAIKSKQTIPVVRKNNEYRYIVNEAEEKNA